MLIPKIHLFRLTICHKHLKRFYWQSNDVRSTFYSFFKERGHQFAPPSSVIPLGDNTLHFVNAGMNQFKPVFLGLQEPFYKMAYNSQKCIRVGGKHNDLSIVGHDSFHHTFFEMMGNWSFGDYFKEESCKLAWLLLTDVYKISPRNLFVTYFGGDESLQLSPDFETKAIWLQMGVPEQQILPFGCTDNFWEMGATGPCGPCTEIHYSHNPEKYDAQYINKGLEDLVEIWNIVFVQYERGADGNITPLSSHYVDTGMGLERITAVLNGKVSNYDTDLFTPLFEKLHQLSNGPKYGGKFGDGSLRDTAYRIIADHSRMITISLCDNLLPNDCSPLKSIIRKCLHLGQAHFGFSETDDWLSSLCECNVEILGEAHPLLAKNINHAKEILRHHEKLTWELQHKSKENWALLIETYPKLAKVSDVNYMLVFDFRKFMLPDSESSESFSTECCVKFVQRTKVSEENFKLIMDALDIPCDSEEIFLLSNQNTNVTKVTDISSESVVSTVISNPYLNTMQHLIMAALNVVTGRVYLRTVQPISTAIQIRVLTFHDLTTEHILQAEQLIRQWINNKEKICRKLIPLRDALANENCTIDYQKKYPLNVWAISISSTELPENTMWLCDQPILADASKLGDFVFDNITYEKNGVTFLRGISGNNAKNLNSKMQPIRQSVDEWKAIVTDALDRDLRLREVLSKWKKWKLGILDKKMPAAFLLQITSEIEELLKKVEIIVMPPSNIEEVLKEGRRVINQYGGNGIFQLIKLDYRGIYIDLFRVFNGDENFPIVLIFKGWGKMAVVAYVPQNWDNISLQTMFEEIISFQPGGEIKFKSNTKNIGCLYMKGIKFTDLDKIEDILKICKSFFLINHSSR